MLLYHFSHLLLNYFSFIWNTFYSLLNPDWHKYSLIFLSKSLVQISIPSTIKMATHLIVVLPCRSRFACRLILIFTARIFFKLSLMIETQCNPWRNHRRSIFTGLLSNWSIHRHCLNQIESNDISEIANAVFLPTVFPNLTLSKYINYSYFLLIFVWWQSICRHPAIF